MRGASRLAVTLAALLLLVPRQQAAADAPIRATLVTATNEFPQQVTFRLEAESDAAAITRVQLSYAPAGAPSETLVPVTVPASRTVKAEYIWKTLQQRALPPGAPIDYRWLVVDEAGNRLQTPKQTVYLDDTRFAWKTERIGLVTVLWYEGDEEFGRSLARAAASALDVLAREAGISASSPVRVVVYADVEEFQSAYLATRVWVGGSAYPQMGLTVQAIPSTRPEMIPAVIPHEVSHLVFYQATHNAYSDPPAWLNEGLAMRSEMGSHAYWQALVVEAARKGQLHTLPELSGGFSADTDEARLAYAESYILVCYIVETYGKLGLSEMLAGLRQGMSAEESIGKGLGVSPAELEAGWKAWVAKRVPAADAAQGKERGRPESVARAWPLALLCAGGLLLCLPAPVVAVALLLYGRRRAPAPSGGAAVATEYPLGYT